MSKLDINITDAFEMGKIAGTQDILKELETLSIIDDRFYIYVKSKLKHLNEKIDLMTKYKAIADFKGEL